MGNIENVTESPIAHATMVLAAIIIFFSVVFEMTRNYLKRTVPHLFQPILTVLYSELTNGGLIGILIFLCGHVGHPSLFEWISIELFGEGEILLEMVGAFVDDLCLTASKKFQAEGVHMLVFLFMVLLIIYVISSLFYVKRSLLSAFLFFPRLQTC